MRDILASSMGQNSLCLKDYRALCLNLIKTVNLGTVHLLMTVHVLPCWISSPSDSLNGGCTIRPSLKIDHEEGRRRRRRRSRSPQRPKSEFSPLSRSRFPIKWRSSGGDAKWKVWPHARHEGYTLDVDEEFMHFSGQHFAATRCFPDIRAEFLHKMGGPTGFTPLLYILF